MGFAIAKLPGFVKRRMRPYTGWWSDHGGTCVVITHKVVKQFKPPLVFHSQGWRSPAKRAGLKALMGNQRFP